MFPAFLSSIVIILFVFFIVHRRRVPKTFIPDYSYNIRPLNRWIEKRQNFDSAIVSLKNLPNPPRPYYRLRRIMIHPSPSSMENRHIANSFEYKTWDGTLWTAFIIDDQFYVKEMGSSRLFKTQVLNILRFRSQQWQMAYDKNKNQFIVFRFNGITGIPYKKIDIIDWNDYSYDIEPLDEIKVDM